MTLLENPIQYLRVTSRKTMMSCHTFLSVSMKDVRCSASKTNLVGAEFGNEPPVLLIESLQYEKQGKEIREVLQYIES